MTDNTTHGNNKQTVITDIERRKMIAEAAYYRSQKRDPHNGGNHTADWLAAEAEIDTLISEILANLALGE